MLMYWCVQAGFVKIMHQTPIKPLINTWKCLSGLCTDMRLTYLPYDILAILEGTSTPDYFVQLSVQFYYVNSRNCFRVFMQLTQFYVNR